MPKIRSLRRIIPAFLILFLIAFGFYLASLYRQLDRAFAKRDQFVPTRIYSDVTRIAPPMPRATLVEKLQSLNYSYKTADSNLSLTLRPMDYPAYLIADNDPTAEIAGQMITLRFDSADSDALLHSIEVGGREIPNFYLEPVLVATLSRGNLTDPGAKQIRDNLNFDEIPALMWKAIIAVEDQHFMEHKGLDPRGLARAIYVDLRTRSLAQGGSTLTLQLVKNLMVRRGKNIFRKVNELFLALLLEMKFDKQQILERYLNEVYLGQVGSLEIHGVSEGAEHFFGKKLEDLNLAEIALLAGQVRGTGYYSPYKNPDRAFERQRIVLRKMVETGQIAQGEADAALKMQVRLASPQSASNRAPFFADFVKAELIRELKEKTEDEITNAGFRVYSTIDLTLNTQAQRAVTKGVEDLEKRMKIPATERLEGALASVDQSTGYIRALVGGSNYAKSNFNRILNMKRQVGSTFKPFVYLTALAKGYDPSGVPYSPVHPAEDSAWILHYDHGNQNWNPRNYEREFMGWISLRTALAHSINTVAAKLGFEVGIDNIIKTARELGIESALPAVPSLALGVAELSPVELLRAYSAIANHGVQDELTVIRAITETDGRGYKRFVYHPKQVFDPAACDLLTDMLTSVFTDGTARAASAMGFDRVAAGKTGTTSQHRDSWFAGYTPQLTTVVWVGMDQDQTTKTKLNLTGATAALPVWVNYMKKALAEDVPAVFNPNAEIVNLAIDTRTGRLAQNGCPVSQVINEKFLKKFQPTSSSCENLWPATVPETTAP